jgi:1,4-alpha-glucan branching enzyme
LNEHDFYLLKEGTHCRLYDVLGCHLRDGGARVAVWAPNARQVSVIGDFNGWDPRAHPLGPRGDSSGIWEVEVPGLVHGGAYKFRITPQQGEAFDKADPFAFAAEEPPRTASRAWSLDVAWNDADWMNRRAQRNGLGAPISIYEVHLGSWRRRAGRWLSYRELAVELSRYVLEMGFTRVELLPVCEHPFYGSWGYQTTGFFAPTARYGPPQDLMFLVDTLHQHGIGVPLDRVPSRCPDDPHGLSRFDGTALFEHDDPRQGFHPDWHSSIFNYGRHEVRAFLLWPTSGSTTTTSTACGWTPWPRCSTSTTGGSRASGFRTGTAARKTSRPSSSCGSSTPRCTGTMPAC